MARWRAAAAAAAAAASAAIAAAAAAAAFYSAKLRQNRQNFDLAGGLLLWRPWLQGCMIDFLNWSIVYFDQITQ